MEVALLEAEGEELGALLGIAHQQDETVRLLGPEPQRDDCPLPGQEVVGRVDGDVAVSAEPRLIALLTAELVPKCKGYW